MKKTLMVLLCVLGALIIIVIGLLIYISKALQSPTELMPEAVIEDETQTPSVDTGFVIEDPGAEAVEETGTDKPLKSGIINILLVGLDVGEEGRTTSGTEYHADVIMVVVLNTENKTIDLVSLPRDSVAHIPGVKGIYKLNASINIGGGKDAPGGAGFLKVCEAAQWMLGGICIDYYYGVEYESVIELVDAIGGVDFNVDISTSSGGTDGNGNRLPALEKGMQHMDGKAVLSYLRARRNVVSGGAGNDRERVNRQKKMLVAIFKELQQENLITSVPAIIHAVSQGLYTNTTMQQTLSMASFARNIDADSIGMYSLSGPYDNAMSWNWTFVDQDNRVSVIKDIYGVDVEKRTDTSHAYADWMEEYGFNEWKYIANATKVGTYALESSSEIPLDDFKDAYTKTITAFDKASVSFSSEDTNTMLNAMDELKKRSVALAEACGYTEKLAWINPQKWWQDEDINEVLVDFR